MVSLHLKPNMKRQNFPSEPEIYVPVHMNATVQHHHSGVCEYLFLVGLLVFSFQFFIASIVFLQIHISKVFINGLNRTKDDFAKDISSAFFNAKTLGQVGVLLNFSNSLLSRPTVKYVG